MVTKKRRTCYKCKRNLGLRSFKRDRRKKHGRSHLCLQCTKEAARTYNLSIHGRQQKRKQRQLRTSRCNALILGHLKQGCVDCGEKDPVVLEFDHVKGTKEATITELRHHGTLGRLTEELEKCVVRCANCHRRKTARDNGDWRLKLSKKPKKNRRK